MANMANTPTHVPAPWTCKAESYWLIVGPLSTLPAGAYAPLEAAHEPHVGVKEAGGIKGGLGFIMVVRYTDTPVGPYDELLIVPGEFDVPGQKVRQKRITRIYVSQRETCYNGRVNWNIPKHLAHFEFTSPVTPPGQKPPSQIHVSVYPPDSATGTSTPTTPFFSATITPFTLLPSMPFSSRYLPISSMLAQPPLPSASPSPPAAGAAADNKTIDSELLIGTTDWKRLPIAASSPAMRGCWVEMHTPKEGSDEEKEAERWWPVKIRPWSMGCMLHEGEFGLPEPEVWKP